nr:ABC transporter ATP-binding protein [Cupriavidus plantarum]
MTATTPDLSVAPTPATAPHSRSRGEDIVVLDDVDFAYADGDKPILSGLTMRFPRGKVVAVMGGSGCGKTTVLRLIGGQVRPRRGQVTFAGKDIDALDQRGLYAVRRQMGMLFQFGALFTDLSVFDNVAFPLREHTDLPDSMIRDLVLMKLNAVGLRGARDLMPAQISGGMARRVALARAIALDPSLLMYDEPFAGLDPISLGLTARLIRSLNDALGATTIIVSHDVQETFQIADYVYFIANGRIAAEGEPDALRASTDPFVHQFVHAEADGPVPFHYGGPSLADDFLAGGRR